MFHKFKVFLEESEKPFFEKKVFQEEESEKNFFEKSLSRQRREYEKKDNTTNNGARYVVRHNG